MNILKTVSVTFALALLCSTAHSQVGKRLQDAAGRSAERAATKQTEQRTERAVNNAIDGALDGKDNSSTGSPTAGSTSGQQQQQAPANTPTTGGNVPAPTGTSAQTPQQGANALEMAYARNDFVPGDVIFFEDDVANEKMGEFPSQWDLGKGSAEIASIGGEKSILLKGITQISPLMNPSKNYLPDEFTVEYDVFYSDEIAGTPYCGIIFNNLTFQGNHQYMKKGRLALIFSWTKTDGQRQNDRVEITIKPNEWHRVSISFNKRALKYYVNGVRHLNIPNMQKPSSFLLQSNDASVAYFRNIRVAKGAVPLYDRMMSDGKFITYGITFDVGKSTLKPESMGEINRIVTLMKENPTLKFSVEGHTDSTGSAATNQTLSEARSQAVVDKLVSLGIAADRLKAAGKGQSSPLADNGTDEGRAKNRRVEFVKIN
jgi:outer membrane protein OmpA-like peptidoglycan-associated protein